MLILIHSRLIYEIIFSGHDKPKVLSQVEYFWPFYLLKTSEIFDRVKEMIELL
jgi:hypothetical protein